MFNHYFSFISIIWNYSKRYKFESQLKSTNQVTLFIHVTNIWAPVLTQGLVSRYIKINLYSFSPREMMES